MLRTGSKAGCQRVLTVETKACDGVLDAGERLVDHEHVGDVLGALRLQICETFSPAHSDDDQIQTRILNIRIPNAVFSEFQTMFRDNLAVIFHLA